MFPLVAALLFWLLALPCLGDSQRITPTVSWPSYITSAPLDSHATTHALYVAGTGHLYAYGPQPGNRGRPFVLDLRSIAPRRFFPLLQNRLLVGGWRGFAVLDLASPLAPTAHLLPLPAGQVASVDGDIVYYTRHDSFELEAWDVSNPASPALLARFDAPYWDGAVSGRYAYGVNRLTREFLVWDLSDPSNPVPRVVGSAPSEVGARRVLLHGLHAFVLSSDTVQGIEVFDISDPANPKLAGRIDAQGGVLDLAVNGTTAWLTVSQKGLMKLDLANLSAPPVLVAPLEAFPESVRFFGGRLYLSDESSTDLRVFDSESGALVESLLTGETVEAVHVLGSSAATVGRAGVRTFLIRGSGTALPLGLLRLEERIWMSARDGNFLYLNADPGLVVEDLSDPASPRVVFRGTVSATAQGWNWWSTVHAAGGLLFVGTLEGVTVVDVANPSQPAVLSKLPLGRFNSLHRVGTVLYAGRSDSRFSVIDISDPRNPSTLRDVELFATHYLFAREGSLLAVGANHISGSSSGEFVFYDISDPGNPSIIGYGPGLQPIISMEIENGRLFALTSARLRIFDLSEIPRNAQSPPVNLSMPLLAHFYDFDRQILAGEIEGSTIFTAEGNTTLNLWRVDPLIKIRAEVRSGAAWLVWDAAATGTQFELLAATNPSGPWQSAATTSATSIELPMQSHPEHRYFQVRTRE